MDEKECKELIDGVKILFEQRGGKKIPVTEEIHTANFAFASVVSIKNIQKGDILSKENIWVKRPGTGEIKAKDLESLFGKIASKNISEDEFIKTTDFK